jgi:hypothetical protein
MTAHLGVTLGDGPHALLRDVALRQERERGKVMKRWATLGALLALMIPTGALAFWNQYFKVVPREFDPGKSFLVQAEWLTGIGCPTNARLALPNATFTAWSGNYQPYTDPACPTGDPRDRKNTGLLLAKTGPTVENFASAVADIKGVEGKVLTELGYDIRKPGPTHAEQRGSWCGAGAPRFNIETTDNFYFLGCSSPPPNMEVDGDGFIRLTWGGSVPLVAFATSPVFSLQPVTGQVKRLQIVFDEGNTLFATPPKIELGVGLAVLDNINVNGVRVGQGPGDGDDDEDDEGEDDGDTPEHCDHCNDDDDD